MFDGTGDYLSVLDSADWDFGTSDFTIDFWVRFALFLASKRFLNNMSVEIPTIFFIKPHGGLVFQSNDGGVTKGDYTYAWSPGINTWYHIALLEAVQTVICLLTA